MTKSEQFKQEFLALLSKYNAEMRVREYSASWHTCADGVDFDLDGETIDDEYVIYPTVEFGMYTTGNTK